MNFKQSPMYTPSDGTPKTGFVLHGTLGNYVGAVDWLSTLRIDHPSSAHYIIGKNVGEVIQLVNNNDIAWHAGTVQNPTLAAQLILQKDSRGKYINPNEYLIGIEFEWFVGDQLTDWQYNTAVEIIKSSGIINPVLIDHHSICDYKQDNLFFAIPRLQGIKIDDSFSKMMFAIRDFQVSNNILDFKDETNPYKINLGPKTLALIKSKYVS